MFSEKEVYPGHASFTQDAKSYSNHVQSVQLKGQEEIYPSRTDCFKEYTWKAAALEAVIKDNTKAMGV